MGNMIAGSNDDSIQKSLKQNSRSYLLTLQKCLVHITCKYPFSL